LSATGREVAAGYDWQVVARRVLAVYETVVLPGAGGVTATDDGEPAAVTEDGAWSSLLRRVRR
jgi:phosphatidylinositol alpha-mannosyltransferase